jgi:hypothetical protein
VCWEEQGVEGKGKEEQRSQIMTRKQVTQAAEAGGLGIGLEML